jgi:hypothetical protein
VPGTMASYTSRCPWRGTAPGGKAGGLPKPQAIPEGDGGRQTPVGRTEHTGPQPSFPANLDQVLLHATRLF